MKRITKALGIGLLSGLLSMGVMAKDKNIEAKALLCEGTPATVLVVDGKPSYRIVNASLNGVKPVCVRYHKPVTIEASTGAVTKKDCRVVEDYANLDWVPSDIRPNDVEINQEDEKTYVTVDGKTCGCN